MKYNKYIGLPYATKGRDEAGIDCWGLVRLFYKQEFDLDLPSYQEDYAGAYDSRILEMMAQYKDNWTVTMEPEEGFVVLFNIMGEPVHVGIYIGNNKFIHAREGRDTVLESLDSPRWSKRVEGYYKYTPKADVIMSGIPHPFKQTTYSEVVIPGSTLADVSDNLVSTYQISNKFAEKLIIFLDGIKVSRAEWSLTKVQAGQNIVYKVVPEGSDSLRMVAMIALIVVANVYGAEVGAAMGLTGEATTVAGFTEAGAVTTTGKIVGTMAISMAGAVLINAAFPIRPLTGKDPGSSAPVNAFSGASNQANRYGAIPVVLGTMRSTAMLGAVPYIETLTDTSLMNLSLVWGFGPLDITDICVGAKSLNDMYYTAQASSQETPTPETIYGYPDDPVDAFDAKYPTDVEQQFPQIELVNNITDGNPPAIVQLSNYAEDIDIALTFPEGMRKISTRDGKTSIATCDVEISIREHGTTSWSNLPTYHLGNYNSPTFNDASYTTILPATPKYSVDDVTITTYKWYVLAMNPGGGIQVFEGAATDSVNAEPSNWLKALYTQQSYSSFLGTDSSYSRLPNVPNGYLKLYLLCFRGAQYIEENSINYLSSYTHEGLNLTVTRPILLDSSGNAVYDEYNTVILADSIKLDISAGRVITEAVLAPGEVLEVFKSNNYQNVVSVTNRHWSSFLNTYGVWSSSGGTIFNTSTTVTFPHTGYYEIEASSDDTGTVYIDNAAVITIPEGGFTSSAKNWYYAEANSTHVVKMVVTNLVGAAGAALRITFKANSGLNILGSTSTQLSFGSDGLFSLRKDAFNFVYRLRGLPRKKYDLRIIRTNNDVTEKPDDADNRYYTKAVLYAVTGYNKHTLDTQGNLVPIRVVKNPRNCYLARTFIRLQSTNKINGSIEGVNALLTTIAHVYNPSTQNWNSTGPTNNPAALFLYVLMHPANAYRVADNITDAANYVDLNALAEWFTFCQPNTVGSIRLSYNAVLTNVSSVMNVLKDICSAGKASPNYVDGKWTVVVDKPRNTIVQQFTPHNSWGFEATKILPRIPDAFRITLADEAKGYQANEYHVYNVGKTEENAELFEELGLPGVTNFEQAKHIAQWHMAQMKLRPEMYTLNVDFEYLVCNRGDVVRVTHDVPLWGNGSGRIKQCQVGATSLVLTEEIYLEIGKTYVIRVRTNSGSSILKTITTIPETGYYSAITITSVITLQDNINNDDLFVIGELNKEAQELVVLSIEPSNNISAKLTLADYSPQIYTADLSEYIAYNANITTTSNYLVNNVINTAPIIISIKSDSVLSEQISNSNFTNITLVSYTNSSSSTKTAEQVQLQIIPATSMFDDTSSASYYAIKDASSISVPGLESSVIYKARIRYTNTSGNIVGPWSDTFSANNIGKLNNYFNTTSILVALDGTYLTVSIFSNESIPTDFNTYEFRFIQGSGTDDFWDSDSSDIKIIQNRSVGRQSLLDFASPRISDLGVTYRVACRALDNNNNYSSTSILSNIVLTTINP